MRDYISYKVKSRIVKFLLPILTPLIIGVIVVVTAVSVIMEPLNAIIQFFTDVGYSVEDWWNGVEKINDDVYAYEDTVKQYAKLNHIEEYTELILAVMMQESAGQGEDVMQCSASPFNEKGGTITSADYSISVGVKTMAYCLNNAGCESPSDIPRVSLALQDYNFGNGYASWALDKYGGYTLENAQEFSDMHSTGSGYGDVNYVPNVLRYYNYMSVVESEGDGSFSYEKMYYYVTSNAQLDAESEDKFKNTGISYNMLSHLIQQYEAQIPDLPHYTITGDKKYEIYNNGRKVRTVMKAGDIVVSNEDLYRNYMCPWQYALYMFLASDYSESFIEDTVERKSSLNNEALAGGIMQQVYIDLVYSSFYFIPYIRKDVSALANNEKIYSWDELKDWGCYEREIEINNAGDLFGEEYDGMTAICTTRIPISQLDSANTVFGDLYFTQKGRATGCDGGKTFDTLAEIIMYAEKNIGYDRDMMLYFMREASFDGSCNTFLSMYQIENEAKGPVGATVGGNVTASGKTEIDFPYDTTQFDFSDNRFKTTSEHIGLEGVELTNLTAYACQYVGAPYVYGGEDIVTGIDCSAYVQYVYNSFGITLPRSSREQWASDTSYIVTMDEALPGDLLFWADVNTGIVNHVAIYIGNNKIVNASWASPWPSGGVKISNVYYKSSDGTQVFVGVKRVKR